ncbi:MAG TPA: prepilin-type N-terminal cleavage/methylation domain-containing protein [Planctomycetota bacterium]|nr:prepilin-type N-terminal cleavage/methylation domain-containing protein [Planctomycetota bacterium]
MHPSINHRRNGFTLFEVAISLVIVAIGVISITMLIPSGLKQLTAQRFRIYAAAVANQLIDVYANADASQVFLDHEAPRPWDIPIDRRVNAPDLEMRLSNQRYGLMPIPVDIAKRLDSDGDEIKSIIDRGGYVYYVQPNVANSWREDIIPVQPPNDLQRLVVGVLGDAQHNASFSFPMKRWPYYAVVPGPPLHALHVKTTGWSADDPRAVNTPSEVKGDFDNMPGLWLATHGTYSWQNAADPDPKLKDLFNAFWDYLWWGGTGKNIPTTFREEEELNPVPAVKYYTANPADYTKRYNIRHKLGAFIRTAFDYAQGTGLTPGDFQALITDAPGAYSYAFSNTDPAIAGRRVLAISYLSSALMCLTRWHNLEEVREPGIDAPSLRDGAGVPLETFYEIVLPTGFAGLSPVTHKHITNLVRNGRYTYYRFCAANPYNWGVPRAIEHATMMDYPLLELDLFREPARGTIWGLGSGMDNPLRGGAQAYQWKYLAPTPITSLAGGAALPFGPSMTYLSSSLPAPDLNSPTAVMSENGPANGTVSHFTVTNRFAASERCRQLVFWVVDWQSYEDCETAPSAPVDASRYPKAAPGGLKPVTAGRGWTTTLAPNADFHDLMWGFTDGWGDSTGLEQTMRLGGGLQLHRALVGSYVHAYRNPEKNLLFTSSVKDLATGTPVRERKIRDIDRTADLSSAGARMTLNSPPDYGPPTASENPKPPAIFAGSFGADRNGNDVLDRGPVPRSVRMRGITVARYNFYDTRLPGQMK